MPGSSSERYAARIITGLKPRRCLACGLAAAVVAAAAAYEVPHGVVDGVSVCSVRSWPAWRMVSWVPGPSPRIEVTSVWLASTISRKPPSQPERREMLVGQLRIDGQDALVVA